jgi:hypothetical protein
MVRIEEYLRLRHKPTNSPAMHQKWRDLSFLHFATDPQEIQKLIPDGLQVDTFPDSSGQERAWVGLVPFWMTGVRPSGLPALPRFSTFPETNLRTYVHRKGREPAVWFFSLEAANRIACAYAREFFGLPYHWSKMSVKHQGEEIEYHGSRKANPEQNSVVRVQIGTELPLPEPGTLEFFLVERYLLYSVRKGQLFKGLVNHKPYPIKSAQLLEASETLTTASGIIAGPWTHVLFSLGVDVDVFGVEKLSS